MKIGKLSSLLLVASVLVLASYGAFRLWKTMRGRECLADWVSPELSQLVSVQDASSDLLDALSVSFSWEPIVSKPIRLPENFKPARECSIQRSLGIWWEAQVSQLSQQSQGRFQFFIATMSKKLQSQTVHRLVAVALDQDAGVGKVFRDAGLTSDEVESIQKSPHDNMPIEIGTGELVTDNRLEDSREIVTCLDPPLKSRHFFFSKKPEGKTGAVYTLRQQFDESLDGGVENRLAYDESGRLMEGFTQLPLPFLPYAGFLSYKAGKRHGPAEFRQLQDSLLVLKGEFLDDKFTGEQTTYKPDKSVAEVTKYKDGKPIR